MKPTYEELQKQIDRLLSEIRMPKNSDEAASMALIGMAWLDANDKNKLTEVQNEYLAEVRVQAGKAGFIDGWSMSVCKINKGIVAEANEYANQLRQQAKAGEV